MRATPTDVWRAFVEPEELTRFWLSEASGPLAVGATVRWSFMVGGAEVDATATELVEGERIAVDWSDGSTVTWTFTPFGDDQTTVTVVNAGVDDVAGATQGFALVLCDLKVLLETGASPGIVAAKARLIESSTDPQGS